MAKPHSNRELAERLHAIITAVAAELAPTLYCGQPGYAKEGQVVVFFRCGQMDKVRYSTFGVSPQAALDEKSGFWPTFYAIIDPAEQA